MKETRDTQSRRLNPLAEARALIFGCGLSLTVLAAVVLFNPPSILNFLNYRVYDLLLSVTAPTVPSDVPILIGIDDKSLEAYGQWPWPRYRLAQLVDNLNQAGVDAVALDMLMPEADRTSPEVILHERQRDLGVQPTEPDFERTAQKGNDRILAESLARAASVLSYKFLFSEDTASGGSTSLVPLDNIVIQQAEDGGLFWPAPSSALLSLDPFIKAESASGFTNVRADGDGILRRVPLLMEYRAGYYPSLALAALRLASKQSALRLKQQSAESSLLFAGHKIPLDEQGRLLLTFYKQDNPFAYYSAADVLNGQLAEGSLSGKIAFVGAWASGLGDRHATPINKSTPGLQIHAVIASNLLSGSFLHQPAWARGAELFFVLTLGLLSTWLIARLGFSANIVLLLVGAVLPLGGAYAVLKFSGIYIPPTIPFLILIVNCGILGIVRSGIEAHKVFTRTRDLVAAQDCTIFGMISLSSARDEETGDHIIRTQLYVKTLAEQLRTIDAYRNVLSDDDIELLFMSAPLHDIGKVGIPDAILQKPGKLTKEEFDIMKTHPVIGEKALAETIKPSVSTQGADYLDYARDVVISHHEKWDGSGYPAGLVGDAIPLAGRLMALADVFDALSCARVYKPAFPHEKVKQMIIAGRGSHFDPDVVDAFLESEDKFISIAEKYSESPVEMKTSELAR